MNLPDKCNICSCNLVTKYDARIPGMGWATMCRPCFNFFGCSLGTGRGQMYVRNAKGVWEKKAG